MLTFHLMAALGLAILWLNTLLIVAAAWQDARALGVAKARFRNGRTGTVTHADGVFARFTVEQVGRATDPTPPVVLFVDRAYRSEVMGGTVTRDDGRVESVTGSMGDAAEVWVDPAMWERARSDAEQGAFGPAYADARRPRGFVRTLEVSVREGDRVWLTPAEQRPVGVSTVDPARLCGRHQRTVVAFMVGALVVAAACTALAMSGPPSTLGARLGGVACLVFFLLVQPAGVALRNAVRLPHRALVAGRWRGSAADVRATA